MSLKRFLEEHSPTLTNLKWLDLSFNRIKVMEGLDKLVNLTDLTLDRHLLWLTDYRTVPSWIYSRLVTIWFDLLSRFWLILGGLQRRRLDLSICRCWMFMAILLLSRMAKGIGSMRLIWLPICPTLDTWITFLLTRGRGNRLPIVMRSLGAERTRLNFYRIWKM